MTWALDQDVVSEPKCRFVLLCLANYAGPDGKAAFPSIKSLCLHTGLSESTVRRKLQDLEDSKVIRKGNPAIAAAYIKRGDKLPNVYDIDISRGVKKTNSESTGCQIDPERGVKIEERGVSSDTQSVLNPLQENQKKASSSGSRLPDDWYLPREWFNWAVKERPELDINAQGEMFRDYWHAQAGAKGRKADWQATWRNWIRNARAPRANGFHAPVNNGAQPAVLGDFHDHPDFMP